MLNSVYRCKIEEHLNFFCSLYFLFFSLRCYHYRCLGISRQEKSETRLQYVVMCSFLIKTFITKLYSDICVSQESSVDSLKTTPSRDTVVSCTKCTRPTVHIYTSQSLRVTTCIFAYIKYERTVTIRICHINKE